MTIKEKELTVLSFELNPMYLPYSKTFAKHSIANKFIINCCQDRKDVILQSELSFISQNSRDVICKGNFKKILNVSELNKPSQINNITLIQYSITTFFEEIKKYILEKIPPDTIEIVPPLITFDEIETLAILILNEL